MRLSLLAFVLGVVSLFGACSTDSGGSGGNSGAGGSSGNGGRSSGGTSNGKGGTSSGGHTGDPPMGGADAGGADTGGTTAGGTSSSGGQGGATTSCVTETRALEDLIEAGAGGQIDFTVCDFNVPSDVDDNFMNVFIGGTQLCWLGSSQGCDMHPYGFWLNSGQIVLCDVACSAYFDPEPDVPVTIQLGCEIDSDCQ